MSIELLKIHGDRVVSSLQEARDKLDAAESEVALDFSSVRRRVRCGR
ncbi:MAG: hypothetical protein HY314_02450 [Acidobacteria bacterium]|nr:hypothetical protein [Acidobacteriota bacterium]